MEQAYCIAHMTGAARQIADQQRQERAQGQSRHDQCERRDDRRDRPQAIGDVAREIEDMQRRQAAGPAHELDGGHQRQQRDDGPLRQPAAAQAAETEPQREGRDHDRHRLDAAAQKAEDGELIDQGREGGEEKQHAERARPAGVAVGMERVVIVAGQLEGRHCAPKGSDSRTHRSSRMLLDPVCRPGPRRSAASQSFFP